MPRRGNVPKREVLPDPMYNSVLVTKLVNSVMLDGKKGVAQKVVYSAFDMIKDIIATVKKAQAGRADIPVVIAADKVVQYEQVVNVMKQLQAADIARVGLSLKVEK